MPTAYTWQFEQLEVIPTYQTVTNAVSVMHWRMLANDGAGHTAQAEGAQPCGPVDVNNFIPFSSLTESIVTGWLEAAMGTAQIDAYRAWLDEQIAAKVSPALVGLPPPWQ